MKNIFLPILFFFVITLAFFYPVLLGQSPFPGDLLVSSTPYNTQSYLGFPPGGVPNKAQGADVIWQFLAWKYFVIDSLKQGQIPFWTPYNFSGNTLMANFQTGVFYPFNIFFFVVPFLSAWTLYIIIAPFLASFFTYLFLRLLSLSKIAAAFGGIVFAFSSYMVVWMEYGNITHTFLWLPLALYFTEKYIQRIKWQTVLWLTLILWLSFLAGYIQGYFYLLIIVLVYYFVKVQIFAKQERKKTIIFSLALVFPVLLSLFQLLPTLELFRLSSRGDYSFAQITQLLNPWWYSITAIIPDFFGHPASRNFWFPGTYIERVSYFGMIPFFLSIVAFLSSKKKEIKVFSILFVVSFLLSLDLFFTRYVYLLPIPVLSTTVPTRILSIFCFSGAILAAYGFDLWRQGKLKKRFIFTASVGIVIIMGLWAGVLFAPTLFAEMASQLAVTKRNLILPSLLLSVFFSGVIVRFTQLGNLLPHKVSIVAVIFFLCTIGDLFYSFHKIVPFSPTNFFYPKTDVISYLQNEGGINRFWGYGSAAINGNFQTYDKTFSTEGLDALHYRWYAEFLSTSYEGKIPEVVSRDHAIISPGYGVDDLRNNPYRQQILNLLGVKYLLFKNESQEADLATFSKDTYKLVWQKDSWQIYENLKAVPRFFLTNQYEVISDKQGALSRLFTDTFDEKNGILQKDPKIAQEPLIKQQTKLVIYSPNTIVIKTNATTEALLFLSDTYSPNWVATVDGKEKEILRANHAFRAVVVPKGEHIVKFYYRDNKFEFGLLLSAIAAVGFVGFLLIIKKVT